MSSWLIYYIVLGVVTVLPIYILFGIMFADMTKGHIFSFIPRNPNMANNISS